MLCIPDVNAEDQLIHAAVAVLGKFVPAAASSLAATKARETDYRQRAERAEAFSKDAGQYMKEERYTAAVKAYTEAIHSDNTLRTPAYLTNRALAHIKIGTTTSLEQAVIDSREALARDPTWQRGIQRLGHAHLLLKHYTEALALFNMLQGQLATDAAELKKQATQGIKEQSRAFSQAT